MLIDTATPTGRQRMPLFIDRLPFHRWTDQTQKPPSTYWAISLPMYLTDAGLSAPPTGHPFWNGFSTPDMGRRRSLGVTT
jgi:hypothetical protein